MGRSHFRDFKHLYDIKELFEADISLLMFDLPPADRLAVIGEVALSTIPS